jgi:hypothetical protein
MKYGKYWFHLQLLFFIANFHVLGLVTYKFRAKKKIRLSRGVAVRVLVEICIDDISAVLRTTDLRFWLPFVSWAGLMHLILRILKSLEQTQESKKI